MFLIRKTIQRPNDIHDKFHSSVYNTQEIMLFKNLKLCYVSSYVTALSCRALAWKDSDPCLVLH